MLDQSSETAAPSSRSGSPRASTEAECVSAALATLDAAVALARGGDTLAARHVCAAVLFDQQPMIAARPDLLQATLHALLVARALKLFARLVMTMTGRNVQVVMLVKRPGAVDSPQRRDAPDGTIYALDPRWIESVSPSDAVFRDWCDAVLEQGLPASERDAVPMRHLEVA